MISRHTPALVAHKAPYRKQVMYALLLVCNHRAHHVRVTACLEESEQGMLGAIGVPKREDGVVGESLCAVNVAVESAILMVYVHVYRRIYHRMI